MLEQRIARVHRMGQNRPVRVVNFVTRGTIEERVLRTLARPSRGCSPALFEGDADEIPFEAAQASGFLDSMRALVNEGVETRPLAERVSEPGQPPASSFPCPKRRGTTSPNLMWQGVAQLLEAGLRDARQPHRIDANHPGNASKTAGNRIRNRSPPPGQFRPRMRFPIVWYARCNLFWWSESRPGSVSLFTRKRRVPMSIKSFIVAAVVAATFGLSDRADAQWRYRNSYPTYSYSYPTYSYTYPTYTYPSYYNSSGVVTSGYTPATNSSGVITTSTTPYYGNTRCRTMATTITATTTTRTVAT